jgi:hypothetical protein
MNCFTPSAKKPSPVNFNANLMKLKIRNSHVGRVSDSVTRHFEAHASGYG